jgi:hypothetical protein
MPILLYAVYPAVALASALGAVAIYKGVGFDLDSKIDLAGLSNRWLGRLAKLAKFARFGKLAKLAPR